MSRVARDEPSGSASGEEGGLGFSVGVEEEEQAFSIRVRKKVSDFFGRVRKMGSRGNWGETEALVEARRKEGFPGITPSSRNMGFSSQKTKTNGL